MSKLVAILFFPFTNECLKYFKNVFNGKLQMFWSVFDKMVLFHTSTTGTGILFSKKQNNKKRVKKMWYRKKRGVNDLKRLNFELHSCSIITKLLLGKTVEEKAFPKTILGHVNSLRRKTFKVFDRIHRGG